MVNIVRSGSIPDNCAILNYHIDGLATGYGCNVKNEASLFVIDYNTAKLRLPERTNSKMLKHNYCECLVSTSSTFISSLPRPSKRSTWL